MTPVVAVIDRLRHSLDTTLRDVEQRAASLEGRARRGLQALGQQAQGSFVEARGQLHQVPGQLRGAWDHAVGEFKGSLDLATRDELEALGRRLDALSRRLARVNDLTRTVEQSLTRAAHRFRRALH